MTINADLDAAITELTKANDALAAAQAIWEQSALDRTAALDRVNAAQKAVDALVEGLKTAAPPVTDWGAARFGAGA